MLRALKIVRRNRVSARQRGFSLVELAIVILIMGLILGGLAMPLATQRENARFRDAGQQLDDVQAAIEGFALVNGYLPCPATPSSAGTADGVGNCVAQHGFIPATTLDLEGSRNDDNLLLDPWGSPLLYSVSRSDADGDGQWDFTTPGELSDVTMPVLAPDLAVCSTATGASATACAGASQTLTSQAPFLVVSLGKDWTAFSSSDQLENVGTTMGGGPSGASYRVADDNVFVSRGRSNQPGSEFDDALRWLSPLALYRSMVAAGRLP